MKIDDVIRGKVTAIKPYGAFVDVGDRKGLVHISEISDRYVHDIEDYLSVGKTYAFKVLSFDEQERPYLSFKALNKSKKRLRIHLKRGFDPLRKRLSTWIRQYKESNRMKREKEDER